MSNSLAVVLFAGPLLASGTPSVSTDREPVERWSSVSLSAELAVKDTHRVDAITAGEEQKSSLEQCEASQDAVLCQVLVSVVNAGAVLGSVFTGW